MGKPLHSWVPRPWTPLPVFTHSKYAPPNCRNMPISDFLQLQVYQWSIWNQNYQHQIRPKISIFTNYVSSKYSSACCFQNKIKSRCYPMFCFLFSRMVRSADYLQVNSETHISFLSTDSKQDFWLCNHHLFWLDLY